MAYRAAYTRGALADRFWAKVERSDGCWMWTASTRRDGYGQIKRTDGVASAHRVSYELHYGAIPVGMCVLHRCDVKRCVRPDHLFLGTDADNVHDMHRKGRNVNHSGERNGKTSLVESQVITILASTDCQRVLAERFGVSRSCIAGIKRRANWRHVETA